MLPCSQCELQREVKEKASLLQPAAGMYGAVTRASVGLAAEGGALLQAHLAPSWSSQDGRARAAGDHRLAVGEDGGDVEAALALDVHEVAVGALNKALKLMLLRLQCSWRGPQVEINVEHHGRLCAGLCLEGYL